MCSQLRFCSIEIRHNLPESTAREWDPKPLPCDLSNVRFWGAYFSVVKSNLLVFPKRGGSLKTPFLRKDRYQCNFGDLGETGPVSNKPEIKYQN